ncbi:DNA repair protein RecO [Rothia aerolata]|uniref:DNA repair protein RecO n=1 Tax=Rothia aerolata TaxID=1812262 RepID=A0A917MQ88_9MICC|nr:DNA repair protein RecO [Rothia aerolata]GGH57581.1 DNA repair protein RecO [Rothia aerolata]
MALVSTPSKNYRDRGVVLRTQPLGETDRIIILLTRSSGLVHAVAKGVRKGNSRFGGRLEPFMYLDISLVAGKKLHTVSQVQTRHAYTASLMADFDAYSVATVISELAESLLNFETEQNEPFFDLLVGALASLARSGHPALDVFTAFALRAMGLAGWGFSLQTCSLCGRPAEPAWFSAESGVVCDSCARSSRVQARQPISPEMLTYLENLRSVQWSRISPADSRSLSTAAYRIIIQYVQWHLEKPLRSVALIEKEVS